MSGCTPSPLNATADGELVAVLATLSIPETLPLATGVNEIARESACPGARTVAPEKPLTLNPAPLLVTDETVTLPVPVFVKLTAFEALAPTS